MSTYTPGSQSSVNTDDLLPLIHFITLGGNPAATADMNVNGSVTPQVFGVSPALLGARFAVLTRMVVLIEDSGNLAADNYGALSALTAGVRMTATIGGVEASVDGGLPIKSNVHWARICYDMTEHSFGNGNNFISARCAFDGIGIPLTLKGADSFDITVNDNLTGLVEHHVLVQGYVGGVGV